MRAREKEREREWERNSSHFYTCWNCAKKGVHTANVKIGSFLAKKCCSALTLKLYKRIMLRKMVWCILRCSMPDAFSCEKYLKYFEIESRRFPLLSLLFSVSMFLYISLSLFSSNCQKLDIKLFFTHCVRTDFFGIYNFILYTYKQFKVSWFSCAENTG